ncbi:MAG: hypothetical protein IMZ61_03180 [Planctomycetes bacterium]|nr:hypothetical protein [Planctomycetota bacterium]
MNEKAKASLLRHRCRPGRKDCVLPPIRISASERAEVVLAASGAGFSVSGYLLALHRAFMERK